MFKRESLKLCVLSCLAYFVMDVPVRLTGVMPYFAGIKNFLPFTLGLFFGAWGTLGCIAGSILSSLIVPVPVSAVLSECWCIFASGLGMFFGWHLLSKSHRISFKTWSDFGKYILLLAVLSCLCMNVQAACAYFITGVCISIPVNILFASIFYVEPVMPFWCRNEPDAEFQLTSDPAALDEANEIIEESAMEHSMKVKRVFEIQSLIEEISSKIFGAVPSAEISLSIMYGEAVSIRMTWRGEKYNPFRITKYDDEIDIVSLKIIKHRALRASFSHSQGVGKIHVVM